jgi:hypothetical protein
MDLELENFDTDPRWYHDLADGGDNFIIPFSNYLLSHPERVNAFRQYLDPHLKFKEGDLDLYRKEYSRDPSNLFNRGNYIKSILEYRRFRIMHDIAYNIVNIPMFKPITDPGDLEIVNLLAQNPDIFNPGRSRLKEAQYAEIFERDQRPPGPPGPTAPPSNTNRPPRGRGRVRGTGRYRYSYI